jgi:DNA-binding PadR family transcriptional regulator
MKNSIAQEPIPLSEATFFILLSLAPEPKHGYAIMKDVQSLSGSRIDLSTGTLYGALKRLLELEWIERREEAAGSATSARPRKSYALTGRGRQILKAETVRLQTLVKAARLGVSREKA